MSSSTASPQVFKIIPTTQQYDWGKRGRDAKVAQFAEASQVPGFTVDEGKPYAELWMGTHPSSPSRVKGSGEVLSDYLERHPHLIGSTISQKFDDAHKGNLPFLFKVLSIEKALSIQSHPDKDTAKQLHAQSPKIYKDANHKPEMALALTPFAALCGFRPLLEIAHNLRATPELASLIPPSILQSFYDISTSSTPEGPQEKVVLKNLFAAVMTAEHPKVHSAISSIVLRYEQASKVLSENPSQNNIGHKEEEEKEKEALRSLVLRLQAQFPHDIGILCAYLLNHLHLAPGEAIFLGAGEPHAYIAGEAIECMANSDNVIRAGLTPKLRDVPNLVSGLTYRCAEGTRHYVAPAAFGGGRSVLYDPPIEEFSVVKVDVPEGEGEAQREVAGPSLALVTGGRGVVAWPQPQRDGATEGPEELAVSVGDVVFIGAGTPVVFSVPAGEREGLSVYRAFVEA